MNRLSLNQWTIREASLSDAVAGCLRHGIPAIGIWREKIHEIGLRAAVRLLSDSGLRVSSLCRGGFLTDAAAVDENRRAIDEAAELSAACLVLVPGGLPGIAPGGAAGPALDRDLTGARAMVADALAALVPYATGRGVRLALEPLHPMYCADRSVISTLDQALDLAEPYPPDVVGVVVDAFHVWWDPRLYSAVARAAGRIASLQLSDWLVPMPGDPLLARGMMGDGVIDLPRLISAVAATGYHGDIEVEIFNADVWAADPDDVLARMKSRYAACL